MRRLIFVSVLAFAACSGGGGSSSPGPSATATPGAFATTSPQGPATVGSSFVYTETFTPPTGAPVSGTITLTYAGPQSYRGSTYDAVSATNTTPGRLPATTYYSGFAEAAQNIDDVPCPSMDMGPAESIFTPPVNFYATQNQVKIAAAKYSCGENETGVTSTVTVAPDPVREVTTPAGTFDAVPVTGSLASGTSTETYQGYIVDNDLIRLDFTLKTGKTAEGSGSIVLQSGDPLSEAFPALDVTYY